MLRYFGAVACAAFLLTTQAEARKASCRVDDPHGRLPKFLSFDLDDTKPPYVYNVNGIDSESSKDDMVDILPYNRASVEFETWYFSEVEIESKAQMSRVRMAFGDAEWGTRDFRPKYVYSLFIDWAGGTAGWLNELFMYNIGNVLERRPELAAYPASCRRLD
ncbi:hypothetical protein [Rhizobium sp. CC-YZS058]|uniref:hypothetical protein n=1 Tax=Rhizobium sp. CC-YZS058 TaxID=3042153 RepID=UPI002B05F3C3|nr:hypothetical protein [Rhizobium sp. CC-YZS058]MEA3534288.1 hypothetical protein [Rhizobium sp. CC-YZS058]